MVFCDGLPPLSAFSQCACAVLCISTEFLSLPRWLDLLLLSIHMCFVHSFLFTGSCPLSPTPLFSSCCFLPRSGRRRSSSPPPGEEKDHFEVWAPVVDSEAPSLESPPLPPPSSPSCCGFARPDEKISAPPPVGRAVGGDPAVPSDPGQLETVLEK